MPAGDAALPGATGCARPTLSARPAAASFLLFPQITILWAAEKQTCGQYGPSLENYFCLTERKKQAWKLANFTKWIWHKRFQKTSVKCVSMVKKTRCGANLSLVWETLTIFCKWHFLTLCRNCRCTFKHPMVFTTAHQVTVVVRHWLWRDSIVHRCLWDHSPRRDEKRASVSAIGASRCRSFPLCWDNYQGDRSRNSAPVLE